MDVNQILTKKILMNGIAFLSGVIFLVYFQFFYPTIKRGFFCDDPSLSLNFKGDTISNKMSFVSILSATSIIWITEFLLVILQKSENISKYKEAVFRSISLSFDYLFGWIVNATIVNLLKKSFSEPRPHFFETCQPDTAENCTRGMYVPNFACTNPNYSERFHRSTLTSFPSAHAAYSLYISVFMIWYLQCRLRNACAKYFVAIIQLIILIWPVVCSISRITDNRHHVWDVCAGLVVGFLLAAFVCTSFCNNFKDLDKMTPCTSCRNEPTTTTTEERVNLQDSHSHAQFRKDS